MYLGERVCGAPFNVMHEITCLAPHLVPALLLSCCPRIATARETPESLRSSSTDLPGHLGFSGEQMGRE